MSGSVICLCCKLDGSQVLVHHHCSYCGPPLHITWLHTAGGVQPPTHELTALGLAVDKQMEADGCMGAQSHRESQGDQLSSDWQVGEWADRWIDGLCTCFHQVVVPGGSYQSWLDLCARAPPPRLWAHGLGQCPSGCALPNS